MLDISRVIKPGVKSLRAYTLSPHRAAIKINQNENPWDAPERIKTETLRLFANRQWSRYPDFVPLKFHEALAGFAAWQPDGVIAGNGSNELIQALLMVTVSAGTKVLISEPTFALYRQVTTVLGGEVLSVALNSDLQFDGDALLDVVQKNKPEVIILCSPNNPTGGVVDEKLLRRLLLATSGLVVVDEAYHEFAEQTVVPLLKEFDNLVVLRTFSKAMALAALRVGYLLAAPALVHEVHKAVLPYNLNAFSQTAAEVSLKMYQQELLPLVKLIISERQRLFAGLKRIEGLNPVPSRANFICVRSRIPPKDLFSKLVARDILVRDVSGYPMLNEYFRTSVGTPEENDALLSAIGAIFAQG